MADFKVSGFLRMMEHKGTKPVSYFLSYATYPESSKKQTPAEEFISHSPLNDLIGRQVRLSFTGRIRCLDCGRLTNKSFSQGSCFPCFQSRAKNDMCILKPELCHYHKGTCREPDWGLKNCFKPHTVYFANSSGIKVGITKEKPISNRWVDQGAVEGIPLLEIQSRREAGVIENYLSKFLPDKTSWQKMVSSNPDSVDLVRERNKFLNHLSTQSFELEIENGSTKQLKYQKIESETETIEFPVSKFPAKVKSYKADPNAPIKDKLVGIKGQYLLFENGVINLRSVGGYEFSFESE